MNEPKLRFKADDGSQFPDWEEHKIKEFVTESNILGHTGKEAKKLTVKLWAKGVVPKENVFSGSENTQYYIRHSGQLMYGKLDFLNCAFGIVPPELDGYESTLDAPAFDMHDISDKFLLCYVTRKKFYKKNGDIANGSRKAKRIHPDVFGEMSIMVPSLPEQQKIADFLSTIDTVIEKQKETASAWEERKKGVMQKLFSQKVRFKADDGSQFPEWKEKKLDEVFEFYNGKAHENVISENGKYVVVNSKFISTDGTVRKYTNEMIFPLIKKDIVMVMSDVPNGKAISKCFLINENNKYTLNQRICCLRTKENTVFYINQISRNKYFLKFDDGVKQTNLRKNDILQCPLLCPCLAEQQKIADCLASFDEVIEKQKATLAVWEELKKGLLQQMFV